MQAHKKKKHTYGYYLYKSIKSFYVYKKYQFYLPNTGRGCKGQQTYRVLKLLENIVLVSLSY